MFVLGLLLIAVASTQADVALVNGKIKISVVTTSGCGDTVNFIQNQLAETYEKYSQWLELEIIPWGRTVKNDDGSLTCQFGVTDCWANRLHRCVIELLDNQDELMDYIHCEFSSPYPSFLQNTYDCVAKSTSLNLVDVDYCAGVASQDEIENKYQSLAAEPMSIINFVPSIFFNDVIDLELHNEARERLESMICFALAADPSTGVTSCTL